ncbi:MAG TPA: hypothetical protein VK507_04525, partial [Iamia sp.]|nr:hypothetical protein [Iamia sp.]
MPEHHRVAIIGSFKQHYAPILEAHREFTAAGWEITSPLGDPVVHEGVDFVRFTSDPEAWDDAMVQTVALHRILRADLVYVLAPSGYVGRTTCYEIGRVVQADRPVYFSERPEDLPLTLPADHVASPAEVVARTASAALEPLYSGSALPHAELERDLIIGKW